MKGKGPPKALFLGSSVVEIAGLASLKDVPFYEPTDRRQNLVNSSLARSAFWI